jgi:Zn-dependent peptidase ImmA (M78 family)
MGGGLHPLGIRLRQLKSRRGLYMGDHAEKLACLPSDISRIERGDEDASEDFVLDTVAWLKEFSKEDLPKQEVDELLRLAKAPKYQTGPINDDMAPVAQLGFEFDADKYQQLQQLRKRLTKSEPGTRSKEDLRRIAITFLECFDLRNRPFVDFLYVLEHLLCLVDADYYLLVYPTAGDEPPAYSEAEGDVAKRIVLSDHAYLELKKREPQLIFLAAHELAHWLLHGKTLHYSRKLQPAEIEANSLAVELLLPRAVVRRCNTVGQLAMTRGVDRDLAKDRMKELKLGPYRKEKPASNKDTTKQRTTTGPKTPPLISFISYAWEDDKHQKWVTKLAEALQANGVFVKFDRWDVKPGVSLPQFMLQAIRSSSYVILICTPAFAEKADAARQGVGYETSIVTAEIFDSYYANTSDNSKFLPILRSGNYNEAIPSFLRGRAYIDMRDDIDFDLKLEELLRHMYSAPVQPRPPLGERPHFAR